MTAPSNQESRLKGALVATVVALLAVAYPFLIYRGLEHTSARTIGVVLLLATVAASFALAGTAGELVPLLLRRFGLLVAVAITATTFNHPLVLKVLPILTHVWLFVTFGRTLLSGPSLVEQFARTQHDGFPDFLIRYCRGVTAMWCAFFAINVVLCTWLALAAPLHEWAYYTGFLCYVFIAVLAGAEYVFHKTRFRYYEDGWSDRIWRQLCPPHRTALGRRTAEWQASARNETETCAETGG